MGDQLNRAKESDSLSDLEAKELRGREEQVAERARLESVAEELDLGDIAVTLADRPQADADAWRVFQAKPFQEECGLTSVSTT